MTYSTGVQRGCVDKVTELYCSLEILDSKVSTDITTYLLEKIIR